MKIDDKIEMKNSDMIFQEKQQKDLQYHLKKKNKCEYFTGEEILPSNQILVMEQAKFMCSPLGKTNKNRFGKTNKIN